MGGRDAHIAGLSRFANPTTTWLEARSVLRNQKFKIRLLDAWEVRICKHNVNGNVLTPTRLKYLQRVRIRLRLSSQRNVSQEGSHPRTRPRVAAKTDDRVLQQRCSPIDPIFFSASDSM